jgi:small subunit ribosomal protein S6
LRYYELMMVVAPQVDDEGLSAALDRVNHYVTERGGNVVRQERWGRLRRLAYPIKNQTEGNYVLTHLEMEPETTKDLEAGILLSTDVLRHLLVRIDAIPEQKQQTPQVQAEPAAASAAPEDTVAVVENAPEDTAEDTVAVVENAPEDTAENTVAVVENTAEDTVAVVENAPEDTAEDQEEKEEEDG